MAVRAGSVQRPAARNQIVDICGARPRPAGADGSRGGRQPVPDDRCRRLRLQLWTKTPSDLSTSRRAATTRPTWEATPIAPTTMILIDDVRRRLSQRRIANPPRQSEPCNVWVPPLPYAQVRQSAQADPTCRPAKRYFIARTERDAGLAPQRHRRADRSDPARSLCGRRLVGPAARRDRRSGSAPCCRRPRRATSGDRFVTPISRLQVAAGRTPDRARSTTTSRSSGNDAPDRALARRES